MVDGMIAGGTTTVPDYDDNNLMVCVGCGMRTNEVVVV